MFNNQWIFVTAESQSGYRYIRLQDILQVCLHKTSTKEGEFFTVAVLTPQGQYVYQNNLLIHKAEESTIMLMRHIEVSHGRLSPPAAA